LPRTSRRRPMSTPGAWKRPARHCRLADRPLLDRFRILLADHGAR
jgi:hypothetical protein